MYVTMIYAGQLKNTSTLAIAPIYMLSHSKAPKRSRFRVTKIREEPVDLFDGSEWASTLATAIILPT